MNPLVDQYLLEGCGRCSLGGTPACKVHRWTDELKVLRSIINDSGLKEERKWGVPCYTFQGKNVLMLAALKEYCAISFLKGTLLADKDKLLSAPGENSQSFRMLRFASMKDIENAGDRIPDYIQEAIEIEKSGRKVVFKKVSEYKMPVEFKKALKDSTALKKAFDALTPGRQKGYILFFSAAKQSSTREARIRKCIPAILKGKGMHD